MPAPTPPASAPEQQGPASPEAAEGAAQYPGKAAAESKGGDKAAEAHYFRGNRFYELKLWDKAVAEWRRATHIWQASTPSSKRGSRRFYHLRTALAVVFTVLLVHQMLFAFFPRDPFDLIVLAEQQQNQGWWERWLNSGRPQTGDGHKLTVREWWSRLKQRLQGGGDGEKHAGQGNPRQDIDERWAELLRRYGRFGPLVTWDLDYSVISGNGLSRLGDYKNAVRVLEKGIRKASGKERLADLYQGLANAHYYAGYHLQKDGTATYRLTQVGKAARAYENSLAQRPRALSYGNLGWMYFLMGDYDRAERYSKRALSMNNNLHYVRLNLGLNYLVQRKNRESFESYYEVILRNPPADVYLGGITDLREIIRDNSSRYPFAYLMIGVLALKQGELSMAHDALVRFQAGPRQGNYWHRLADGLLKQMDTVKLER